MPKDDTKSDKKSKKSTSKDKDTSKSKSKIKKDDDTKSKKSTTKSKKSDKSLTSAKKSPSVSPKKSPAGTPKKVSPAVTPRKKSTEGTPEKSPEATPEKGPTQAPEVTENIPMLENLAPSPAKPLLPGRTQSISAPPPPQNQCQIHGQPFGLYCETCEEVICFECHYSGGHRDATHKVADLKESFGGRLEYLASRIDGAMKKRDVVMAQIDKVEYRTGEIKSVAGIIEKDIKTEYAGILERLKSLEGMKLAVVQHDLANLQKDIERIDNVLNTIDEYAQGELKQDYPGFLARYKELNEYIEYALAKPFKQNIDVTTEDLTNEIQNRVQNLENSYKLDKLLQLKDQLITDLLEKQKQVSNSWETLKIAYEQRLKIHQMVCAYCGIPLNECTANQRCYKNDSKKLLKDKFTVEDPPADFCGTGRHYFSKPLFANENTQFIQRIIIDLNASIAYNSIRNGSYKTAHEIIKLIKDLDDNLSGKIPLPKFIECFKNKYDISNECFERLAIAIDPQCTKAGKIDYKLFVQHIENLFSEPPKLIEKKKKKVKDDPENAENNNESPKKAEPKVEIMEKEFAKTVIMQSQELGTLTKEKIQNNLYSSMQVFNKTAPIQISSNKRYYKDLDTESELVRAILKTLKRKGIAERQLMSMFEKYDSLKKRVVPIDVFYLVFTKLEIVITNVDIEILIKKWNPDALTRGNINYVDFLRKLF